MSKQDVFAADDPLYSIKLIFLELDIRILARKEHAAAVKMPRSYRAEAFVIVIEQLRPPRFILEQPVIEPFRNLLCLGLDEQSLRFIDFSCDLILSVRHIAVIDCQLARIEKPFDYFKGIHALGTVGELGSCKINEMLFSSDDIVVCGADVFDL